MFFLRKFVAERAAFRCEYCRIAESDSNYAYHHLEHIISRQHGGSDEADNLAYSCSIGNWKKGNKVATLLEKGGSFVPLFNPRTDDWFDHFAVENGVIIAKTPIGAATVKSLDLNFLDKIIERRELTIAGRWP
ncbi:MAG: hypothetical protein OHK0019_25420 [Saprospiraceae bacterium]